MAKTMDDKEIPLRLRTLIWMSGLLLAVSGAFWKTQSNITANQHAIAMALIEISHSREETRAHCKEDIIRVAADVREALRDNN